MKWVLVVLVAMACGPGLKGVGDTQYEHPEIHNFAGELSQASRQHDVVAIRKMLGEGITLGGMWFEDVQCTTKFVMPREIRGAGLDDFARCLANIDLVPSARTDTLPDVAILTYEPGIELEARFIETPDGPWLAWIGYVARRDLHDALPTVSAATLEAQRIDGDVESPLAGPGAFDELTIKKLAYAWLKVCVDVNGVVTSANVREASSPKAARTFGAAAQTWKFRPFMLRGQPTPVCSMMQMRYPSGPTQEVLPLPLPPTALTNLPSQALERIAGTKMVSPDDLDRMRMSKARVARILAALQYCIDETGHVDHIAVIRSSGLPGYDAKLVKAVGNWTHKPYLDEGKPVAVCSSVHFIYSQKAGSRLPGMMR